MKRFALTSVLFVIVQTMIFSQENNSFYGIEKLSATDSTAPNIAICFAGWTVKQQWSNHWAKALYNAKWHELDVGHLYAVKGPKDVAFESLEIETEKFAEHILHLTDSLITTGRNPKIQVIAHSSGAYVAHNFFTHLLLSSRETWQVENRIEYFCLDGGIGTTVFGTTITKEIVKKLKRIIPVYAYDPERKLESANAGMMMELAEKFTDKAILCVIRTASSNCVGRWCLHDCLITKKPHNRHTYDLEHDYGAINDEHPVCWEYLR